MNPIKVSLQLAKANYKAAKLRGDAAACRKFADEIADLKGRRAGEKAAAVGSNLLYKAGRSPADKLTRKWAAEAKQAKKAAKAARKAEDPELAEVKWYRRELDAPDAATRRGALEKLRALLSDSELADVLTANSPDEIVRKSGPSGRSAKAQGSESVSWMVERLADRSIPAAERTAIVDRLTKAAATDPAATTALAAIIGKVR